jgi:hypothetical protein
MPLLIGGAFFMPFKGRNRGRNYFLTNKKGSSIIAESLAIIW